MNTIQTVCLLLGASVLLIGIADGRPNPSGSMTSSVLGATSSVTSLVDVNANVNAVVELMKGKCGLDGLNDIIGLLKKIISIVGCTLKDFLNYILQILQKVGKGGSCSSYGQESEKEGGKGGSCSSCGKESEKESGKLVDVDVIAKLGLGELLGGLVSSLLGPFGGCCGASSYGGGGKNLADVALNAAVGL